MCSRLFNHRFILSAALGGLVAASPAPAQTHAPADPLDARSLRIDIDAFERAPGAPAHAVQLPLPAALFWDNGPRDDVTAHLSQIGNLGGLSQSLLAADDLVIKHGLSACLETITVCFAVSDSVDRALALSLLHL